VTSGSYRRSKPTGRFRPTGHAARLPEFAAPGVHPHGQPLGLHGCSTPELPCEEEVVARTILSLSTIPCISCRHSNSPLPHIQVTMINQFFPDFGHKGIRGQTVVVGTAFPAELYDDVFPSISLIMAIMSGPSWVVALMKYAGCGRFPQEYPRSAGRIPTWYISRTSSPLP